MDDTADNASSTLVAVAIDFGEAEDAAVAQDQESLPGEVRLMDGVLQQAWTYRTYHQSGASRIHVDWRDVPSVSSKEGHADD